MNDSFSRCLICNGQNLVPMKGYEKDHLVKCRACGLVFSKTIPTLQELIEEYAKYSRADTISDITVKRYEDLLKYFEKFRSSSNIIDVGAGDGQFAKVAKEKGWVSYATEFEERAVELCRAKGIITHQGKLDPANYEAGMFDVIFSSEVLEHINNPVEEIQNFHRLLRKGGLVYITTPNLNSISHKFLGPKWNIFHYPEHLAYYTPRTITKLFTNNGFKKVEVSTTGLSPQRFYSSQGISTGTNDDEALRQKTETKFIWRMIKKSVNGFLDLTGTGDAMKAKFIKT